MRRKYIMWLTGLLAVSTLIGCGGEMSYDESLRQPETSMTTLFLRDMNGFSAGGVHYTCEDPSGAVSADFVTAPNGEFTFYPGERCTFVFGGFLGTPGDPLFIQDDAGIGKGDIPYNCYSGDTGTTYPDGHFEYVQDDSCTFYL